jgi:site-specific recombinase XerD
MSRPHRPPKNPNKPSPQYGQKFPAEYLRRDEVRALLDACSGPVGRRNRALITVLYRAGLRLAEALALRLSDLDVEGGTIRVLHGKGNKARTVGIDRGAIEELQQWLREREEWKVPPGSPIFCTRQGQPLKQAYIRAMLPRLAKKAGVERRVHAHVFRHTFAVELAREGVPVSHIQRLLGHSSLNTTSVYLASLSPEEALNAVRGRTW